MLRIRSFFHKFGVMSEWSPEAEIILVSLDLDAVQEEIVKMVGTIEIEKRNTLEDQIHYDEEQARLLMRIEDLEMF